MKIEPAHLGGISFDFARISPRWDEKFPYEHAQVGQPGKSVIQSDQMWFSASKI